MYLNSLVIWCSLFVVFFAGLCFREIVDEYMKHNSYSDKEDQPKLKVNIFGELVEKE